MKSACMKTIIPAKRTQSTSSRDKLRKSASLRAYRTGRLSATYDDDENQPLVELLQSEDGADQKNGNWGERLDIVSFVPFESHPA
jgi:hypothetical protein